MNNNAEKFLTVLRAVLLQALMLNLFFYLSLSEI